MEMLDDRALPSTTIVDGEQFTLTGAAGAVEVTLTVVEDAPGYYGYYHWLYVVENVNYGCSTGCSPEQVFQVDAGSVSGVENLQSSAGWDGEVVAAPDGTGSIIWNRTNGSPILPGGTAEFSFLTEPMPIGVGGGTFVDNDPMGASATGELLAPFKGAKIDFANATVGVDYQIRIRGYAQGPNPVHQDTVGITKTATREDIAQAVELTLLGMGYKVIRDGTTLLIAPPAANMTSLRFQTQTPTGQDDNTLKGPTLTFHKAYEVWVNGVKLNP
jgi:hypothetical protein